MCCVVLCTLLFLGGWGVGGGYKDGVKAALLCCDFGGCVPLPCGDFWGCVSLLCCHFRPSVPLLCCDLRGCRGRSGAGGDGDAVTPNLRLLHPNFFPLRGGAGMEAAFSFRLHSPKPSLATRGPKPPHHSPPPSGHRSVFGISISPLPFRPKEAPP